MLEHETLNADISTAVYRIVQEALTNTMRHANASRVEVKLEERRNRLLLVVRDNGAGITKEALSAGTSLGLIGMRERAFALGGRLKICGASGKETIVIAHIPLTSGGKLHEHNKKNPDC